MYAIVRTGGKQYKASVGDVLTVEKLALQPGSDVTLPALLVVDGTSVTSDAAALAGVSVTAQVLAQTKGPKIRILKYKNKTGYRKRMGHRQQLTQVRVTGIDTGRIDTGRGDTGRGDTGRGDTGRIDTGAATTGDGTTGDGTTPTPPVASTAVHTTGPTTSETTE